jgi:hypothetical protein
MADLPTAHLSVFVPGENASRLKTSPLNSYNRHIGGAEGRGIGFEEDQNERGQRNMKHSFVDMNGYHEIRGPANQLLVLLFMSWFVADQYSFYVRDIETNRPEGYDRLAITVISDKLSGDDDARPVSERRLRWLIDPDDDSVPIVLTRSSQSDTFPGDLLADNIAGWLHAAITQPSGRFGKAALALVGSVAWAGWYVLEPSTERLTSVGAVSTLQSRLAT